MQVGAAHATSQDFDQQLVRVGYRDGTLLPLQRLTGGMQNHRAHDDSPKADAP
jgi:hypothetical protein